MVNLTVEKQLETIIWPTVSVLYLGLLVSFVVIVWKRSWCYGTEQQGSVQRHNACPQRRLRAGGVGAPEAGVLRAALHRDLVLAAQQLHQYPSFAPIGSFTTSLRGVHELLPVLLRGRHPARAPLPPRVRVADLAPALHGSVCGSC